MSSEPPILLVDADAPRRARLVALLAERLGSSWGEAVGSLAELDVALGARRFALCFLGAPPGDLGAWALQDRIAAVAPTLLVLRLLGPEVEEGFGPGASGASVGGLVHDLNNMLGVIGSYASILLEALPASDPNRECALEIAEAVRRAIEISQRLSARHSGGSKTSSPLFGSGSADSQ